MSEERWINVKEEWLETYTGKTFHFTNPAQEEIDIEDIAHALGKLCRYGGHTRRFFSVAEHSVRVAQWVAGVTRNTQLAFEALLHDATEAYLVDVPRPVKSHLPGYKVLEDNLEKAIALKFGLRLPKNPIIYEADYRIIADERAQAMGKSCNLWSYDSSEPLGVTIMFWTPEEAPKMFLRYFHDLETRLRAGMSPGDLLHG